MFVSLSVVGSPATLLPQMVAGSCLKVVAIFIIIIITQAGKSSKTIDLLGSKFLIHAKTFKGVNP